MIPILIVGIVAVLLVGIAVIIRDIPPDLRSLIGLVGLVFFFVMLLMLWSYIQAINFYNEQAREANTLRKMELIACMTDKQLAALEQYEIRVELHITPRGIEKWYIAPTMDLSPEVVRDMTVYCLEWPAFPSLPAQHGMSGWEGEEREWRDRLKAYTEMVCAGGLAQYPKGGQPAQWLVKRKDIVRLLGVDYA